MNLFPFRRRRRRRARAAAACLMLAAAAALAQDPAADDFRRAESLIEALVQRGLLPRARADAMLRDARLRAAEAGTEPQPPTRVAGGADRGREAEREAMRRELRREVQDEVRAEIRDEVLAQADALLRQGGARARPAPAPATGATAPGLATTSLAPAPAATAASAPVASTSRPAAASTGAAETPAAQPAPAPAIAAAAAAPATPASAPVPADAVRVQYVPRVVRDSIRNEIKEEVIAQMRAEAWGSGPPSQSVPEWVDRIRVEGDIRVRAEADRFDPSNPPPEEFLAASQAGVTRAADYAAGTAAGLPLANTLENRERLLLRARLGVAARVADGVSAGLRLATGPSTNRVSMNQTLGNDFNRYTFLLDRAFVRIEPAQGAALIAGRMANPFFVFTDVQFSENLAFDGLAASYQHHGYGVTTLQPFATLGWFPIRANEPPKPSRSLSGLQVGFDWTPNTRARLRLGLAQYAYRGLERRIDQDYDAVTGPGRTYGQYEYEAGLRQHGNTLFLTNSPLQSAAGLTPDKYLWGLASRFRPRALTFASEFSDLAPVIVMFSGELVRNAGFDRNEIYARTGVQLSDGSATGYGFRLAIGAPEVRFRGDWQLSASYRHVGTDAVLDGFTDSDLNYGGTNVTGYTIAFVWGLDRATTLGLRYLSARTIDSPTVRPAVGDRFGSDILHLDLNVRF